MLAKAAASVAAFGAACVAYGALWEVHAYRLRRVVVPCLPPGSDPVRVLHIADIHLSHGQQQRLDWVESLADLEPDVVVNTGDNISWPNQVERLERSLSGLLGVPGVFVQGSNDFHTPERKSPTRYLTGRRRELPQPNLPTEELRAMLASRGWVDLEGRHAVLNVNGVDLEFVGTGDAHIDLDNYAAVAGEPRQGDVRIGVTHAPYARVLDAMVADDADLIMCGHTHGGQVCLPGVGAIITNCDVDRPRVKGLSTHRRGDKEAWLHVSAGIGTSPFAPYRFACPPEATLLTLVSDRGQRETQRN